MSSGLIRDEGYRGSTVQVFVPNRVVQANTITVTHGDVLRFSADGYYDFEDGDIKVPFVAGMVMGIPNRRTQVRIYGTDGITLTEQVVEVM